jgi:hypothetical protein
MTTDYITNYDRLKNSKHLPLTKPKYYCVDIMCEIKYFAKIVLIKNNYLLNCKNNNLHALYSTA